MNLKKLFGRKEDNGHPPVYLASPNEVWHQIGSSTSVSEIRRRLGEPDEKWDDEVECRLQYRTKFGIIEFLCESAVSKGPEKARLKYIQIEAEKASSK